MVDQSNILISFSHANKLSLHVSKQIIQTIQFFFKVMDLGISSYLISDDLSSAMTVVVFSLAVQNSNCQTTQTRLEIPTQQTNITTANSKQLEQYSIPTSSHKPTYQMKII